jgi:hypothetical protein
MGGTLFLAMQGGRRVAVRQDHIRVLMTAARRFDCEIVVRESNPASTQYIGRSGYKPKPIWCKARTGDQQQHPAAGLVVDPCQCSDAFSGKGKLRQAEASWDEFVRHCLHQRIGFKINDNAGPGFGCVLFHGDYLYSDYDLMSVTPLQTSVVTKVQVARPVDARYHPDAPRDYTTKLERQVREFFRQRTGIAMIQHGAETNVPDHAPKPQRCQVIVAGGHHEEIRPR